MCKKFPVHHSRSVIHYRSCCWTQHFEGIVYSKLYSEFYMIYKVNHCASNIWIALLMAAVSTINAKCDSS